MYMYMYGMPGCDIMPAQEGRGPGVWVVTLQKGLLV